MTVLVSILIPVFNAEKYLNSAIESVSAQSYRDLEIIVVNDGSTDGSATILRDLAAKDSRIVIISQPNGGISSALNRGIAAASGSYIARMDADDLMSPNRIATQVQFLEANPDLGFCSSSITLIDEAGVAFDTYCPEPVTRSSLERKIKLREVITYTHPTVTFRTAVGRSLGGYQSQFEPCEDMEFFGRFITSGAPGLVIPEILLNYRVHSGSISGTKAARQIEMTELVTGNFYRRLDGLPEHDPLAIGAVIRAMPFAQRIAYRLRIKARVLRQVSKYDRGSGRWLLALLRLGFAALLQPHKAIAQGIHALRRVR